MKNAATWAIQYHGGFWSFKHMSEIEVKLHLTLLNQVGL